ncbi:hypothetical protein T069G_02223 [Trichoderma breve]|uniref:BZIP domain-containing protein n=1 Tax=Trichoderma breve TaxID=2034170 RepID=A0A9W9JSL2_9HYPO|nr:hypothetical protein T069G_02223 [Trichoderma breve]KAJ4865693.1 hypothetical protein T069G_02223 [Trichoderma breve]
MESRIELSAMHQLSEARDEDDNWTGLKDREARRKRQYRLNSRSYRKRKLLQDKSSQQAVQIGPHHPPFPSAAEQTHIYESLGAAWQCIHRSRHASRSSLECMIATSPSFAPFRLDGSTVFPLSSDHLIPLVQFNAFRGTLTNMTILSVTHLIPPECDITEALHSTPLFTPPPAPPPSLMPTALQQSVPHDTWVDLLPDATMRDNAIRTMHLFHAEDICGDMLGNPQQERNTIEMNGVLVWGNPWDASGWEMTEGFLKKWGFLLKGCWEAMAATNHWRAQRGDEPLVFDVS